MSLTNLLIKKFIPNHENKNDSIVREKFGVLSGIVGIICNVVISIGKFFVGILTSSIAVSADAFNNLSDAVSSIITLICFKTSGNPADKEIEEPTSRMDREKNTEKKRIHRFFLNR